MDGYNFDACENASYSASMRLDEKNALTRVAGQLPWDSWKFLGTKIRYFRTPVKNKF